MIIKCNLIPRIYCSVWKNNLFVQLEYRLNNCQAFLMPSWTHHPTARSKSTPTPPHPLLDPSVSSKILQSLTCISKPLRLVITLHQILSPFWRAQLPIFFGFKWHISLTKSFCFLDPNLYFQVIIDGSNHNLLEWSLTQTEIWIKKFMKWTS